MGDFLLDLRHRNRRCEQAESLRFFPDMVVDSIVRDSFTLFVTRTGRDGLWAPFESREGSLSRWQAAWHSMQVNGKVALASKAPEAWRARQSTRPTATVESRAFAG
jgi:hypothetical protein